MQSREALQGRIDHAREVAETGDLDGAESVLLEVLHAARGRHPDVEFEALDGLNAIYGRGGRVFESLVLARRLIAVAEDTASPAAKVRAEIAACIARFGLYVQSDLREELQRIERSLRSFPVEGNHALHMEHTYVSFGNALEHDRTDEARRHLDRFRELSAAYRPGDRLALCVGLACEAMLHLRLGRSDEALGLLDEGERRGASSPYPAPELSVLRVRCRVALGDVDGARRDASVALQALEDAPRFATSDCIRYGSQLAQLFADELDDPDGAHRAYDFAATAVMRRIAQLEEARGRLPELGLGPGDYEADLVTYRKRCLSTRREMLERVARLFRDRSADDLRGLLERTPDEGLIAVCAWCECVRGSDGAWRAVGHFIPREGQFRITHGICPACASQKL